MECPVTPHIDEHPFDRLSRAIARLPEGRQRNIILDLEAGLTVDESARHRGIPPRTVDWLRHRGRELLLELCAGDAIDGD
jgi:DNA-directed RNA polymerase specialized sigma24 family protein